MEHGGDLTLARRRHGGSPDEWLDLSTGINPHAWPVPAHLDEAAWRRLPARADLEALLAAARAAYGVGEAAGIVAAPGTQALIQWLPRLAPAGAVAVLAPTYAEHARAWRLAGRAVAEVATLDALPDGIRHVVLVNPNNPDGRVLARAALSGLAEAVSRRGGWLVIDESFADVDPGVSMIGHVAGRPIVVLRSFGKFYGLAGIRLGFAVAPPGLADAIAQALGPWAVAGPAVAVGRLALADRPWAEAMRRRLSDEARRLDSVLAAAGLAIVGGTSLYRLARCPHAHALHEALAARRIWVRRFDGAGDLLRFGLPPDRAGLDRLASALQAIMAAHG